MLRPYMARKSVLKSVMRVDMSRVKAEIRDKRNNRTKRGGEGGNMEGSSEG